MGKDEEMNLPVAPSTLILARRITFTRIWSIPWWRIVSWGPLIGPTVGIGVRGRRIISPVGIIVSSTRGVVPPFWSSWRGTVAAWSTVVVVITSRTAITVSIRRIAARTVASGRLAPVIVIRWRRVRATSRPGRSGPTTRCRNVRLSLMGTGLASMTEREPGRTETYISDALDAAAFEFTAIQFFHGRP